MAYFNIKEIKYYPIPVPDNPPYNPPVIPDVEEGSIPDIPRPSYTSDAIIGFYKIYDDDATVNKTLNDEYVVVGTFKTDVDMLNPILEILVTDSNIDLTKFNYCYISTFGRYYYMKVDLQQGGIYYCRCSVDPLTTFRSELGVIPCIIDKQEEIDGQYINDGSYVMGSKNFTEIKNFSGGFDDNPVNILIACGG